ncbi:hypothetical protein PHLGIDRAFT_316246 [Phlebiopsis gigantea 11061_1 CR5-6]|uniref:Uncharacterized protein n=1 Tax=Phlebiopsis gigantea (strain 11061_1 CR5-6) TaxID=745531 RepID=A0A0C3PQR0_PHLG1|nr:hypothetical protein PHLGIDRAFT_316246 [Phlebiopsis gigantea 11061_1 CR5-6]
MVAVLTLRLRDGEITFAERGRFEGCSHVRSLRGALVGCGVQGAADLPCLLNWQTGVVQTLPPSPVSDGRCVAMALRDDLCVVARSSVLSVYSLAAPHPALVQDLRFDHALGSVAVSASAAAPLSLLITSHSGLHVYTVSQDASGAYVADLVAEEALKASTLLTSAPALPRVGASASHVAWTSTPASFFDRQARIVIARVSRDNAAPAGARCPSKIELLSECKDWRLPSLSAMPVMDLDDGMGILAVGNALGELAICNYGGALTEPILGCLRPLPIPAA